MHFFLFFFSLIKGNWRPICASYFSPSDCLQSHISCIFFFPLSDLLLLVGQVLINLDLRLFPGEIKFGLGNYWNFFWLLWWFCRWQTGFSSIYEPVEWWFKRALRAWDTKTLWPKVILKLAMLLILTCLHSVSLDSTSTFSDLLLTSWLPTWAAMWFQQKPSVSEFDLVSAITQSSDHTEVRQWT